ncbi:MAG: hypothetical protein ACPHID_08320 [Thermoplasmatota archaeon]
MRGSEILARTIRAACLSVLFGVLIGNLFFMLEFDNTYYNFYGHSETNAATWAAITFPGWWLTPLPVGRWQHLAAFMRGLPFAMVALLWNDVIVDANSRSDWADPWAFELLIYVPVWLAFVPLSTWKWAFERLRGQPRDPEETPHPDTPKAA